MKQIFKVIREPTINNASGENYTLGRMYLDNVFFCHTCEDEVRQEKKVYGKTAIPCGLYKVTTSFSNRFRRVLPLVLNVPGFEGIRIHGGNRAEDSSGCVLVGQVRTGSGIAQCAATVQRVINAIDEAEELGIETWLEIE